MKFTPLFIGLLLFIVFAGCSPREEKIDGSIFIVTQGGENFKLGLVTVSIFDRQQIDSVLEKDSTDLQNKLTALKTDLKRLNDEKEDLTQKQNAVSSKCDSHKQKLDAAKIQAEAIAKRFDPFYFWGREQPPARAVLTDGEKQQIDAARKTIAKGDELQKQIDKLNLDFTDAITKPTSDAQAVKNISDQSAQLTIELLNLNIESVEMDLADLDKREQEVADLQAMWNKYNPEFVKETNEVNQLETEWKKSEAIADSFGRHLEENQRKTDFDTWQLQNWLTVQPQTYFTGLSTPLDISKTDADGKFSFQMPTKGEFVIAAQAQRQVADSVEKYFWLIRVYSDGKLEMRVMLSNDNLVTANSSETAIRFPTP